MGAFFGSLFRELGRSTGKRISNALFGDKWSTPYRVGRTGDERKSGDNARVTSKQMQKAAAYDRIRNAENEQVRKEYKAKLSSIVNAAIPKEEERLVAFLRSLSVELSANVASKSTPLEATMRRQLYYAACEKFNQAYSELESRYPYNPNLWNFFCTKIKLFFRRNPWRTLWRVYIVILALFTFAAVTQGRHIWPVIKMTGVIVIPLCYVFVMRAIRLNRYRRYHHR